MTRTSQVQEIGAFAAASLALAAAQGANAGDAMDSRGLPLGYRCYQDHGAVTCYQASHRVPAGDQCFSAGPRKYECYRPAAHVTRYSKLPPTMYCTEDAASDTYVCYDQPLPSPPPPPQQSPTMPPKQ
jgi:hypothetical protein